MNRRLLRSTMRWSLIWIAISGTPIILTWESWLR
jgi:hypothetical protein